MNGQGDSFRVKERLERPLSMIASRCSFTRLGGQSAVLPPCATNLGRLLNRGLFRTCVIWSASLKEFGGFDPARLILPPLWFALTCSTHVSKLTITYLSGHGNALSNCLGLLSGRVERFRAQKAADLLVSTRTLRFRVVPCIMELAGVSAPGCCFQSHVM